MKTKILIITHKQFSHLYYEVDKLLNLPLDLEILELGFGELNKIDNEKLKEFDLVITSGAHLEMINKDFYELTYLVPFFPLHFTKADLVKGLVDAKEFGNKILLMHYVDSDFEIELYEKKLNIEIIKLSFSNLEEAEKLMIEYNELGYNVVLGTSSICEIANQNNIKNIFIYSVDSLKLEIIKAYQLASTRNRMINYAKLKDSLLEHTSEPFFILDRDQRIQDANSLGIKYLNKRYSHEIIGDYLSNSIGILLNKRINKKTIIPNGEEKILIDPIINNHKPDLYVVAIKYWNSNKSDKSKPEVTLNTKYDFGNIIHTSSVMKKIIIKAKQYAKSNAPIFIVGESGTGKEIFAQSIHEYSDRKSEPFLPVNCSAIPENILESELFGYEEGAFTGAKKGGKPGFFEMAQNGTIFLDEIGEISLALQAKLLRVLQENELIRLGGQTIIPLNVRILTATNQNLIKLVKEKKFREDLYYRINVLQLNIPSIRERRKDIPLLLKHLLMKYGIHSEQADYLINVTQSDVTSYNWGGNVREMENFIQRFSALKSVYDTTFDMLRSFTDILYEFLKQEHLFIESDKMIKDDPSVIFNPEELERLEIIKVLAETRGNKEKAADALGISRTTLWRRLKEYNLDL